MKKLLGIVVLILLCCTNTYADKKKSKLNFYFDLPEGYILINEITSENITNYKIPKQDHRDILETAQTLNDANLEMIFNPETIVNDSQSIGISSLGFKQWSKNWKENCNTVYKLKEIIFKDAKEKITNFQCNYFKHPVAAAQYQNASILTRYKDPNVQNENVYENYFRLDISEREIIISLDCKKDCNEMIQVLAHITNSITLH